METKEKIKSIIIEDLNPGVLYLFKVYNIKSDKHILTTFEKPGDIQKIFPSHSFYYAIEGTGKENPISYNKEENEYNINFNGLFICSTNSLVKAEAITRALNLQSINVLAVL